MATARNDFEDVKILDNFYQTSCFFPMPVVLVSTLAESGATNLGPYSLCFPHIISKRHAMMLIARGNSNTATNLRRTGVAVLNFIPDHEKALAEMRRVTRPQGVVSACVWDYAEGMQMLRVFWDEVVALDPAMEPKEERHMKLCREGQLGALWKKAGLTGVQERAIVIDTAFGSFDDYWGPFLAGVGPGGAYVASLSEERRKALEARLRKRLPGEGAKSLKARAWCARGVVPAT